VVVGAQKSEWGDGERWREGMGYSGREGKVEKRSMRTRKAARSMKKKRARLDFLDPPAAPFFIPP
jgi:hypothetical protein